MQLKFSFRASTRRMLGCLVGLCLFIVSIPIIPLGEMVKVEQESTIEPTGSGQLF